MFIGLVYFLFNHRGFESWENLVTNTRRFGKRVPRADHARGTNRDERQVVSPYVSFS
jgi:hypothetical protein